MVDSFAVHNAGVTCKFFISFVFHFVFFPLLRFQLCRWSIPLVGWFARLALWACVLMGFPSPIKRWNVQRMPRVPATNIFNLISKQKPLIIGIYLLYTGPFWAGAIECNNIYDTTFSQWAHVEMF